MRRAARLTDIDVLTAASALVCTYQRVRVRLRVRLERLDSPCVIKIVDASIAEESEVFAS